MALKMRPTGLASGFYKDDVDYSVFCGEWCIGRIYEKRSSPEHLRWFWSFADQGPMTRSDRVATFEESQGALSEELGRLEVMGEAGRGGVNGES